MPGTKATSLRNRQGKVILAYDQENGHAGEIEADRMLVALGRRPDFDGLDLDKAGVNYGPRGIIADKTLRTSAPNIYACGDIVGPEQLASMAEYQGIIAATNVVLPVKRKVDYRNNVYVIFTEPTLAFWGLTEAQGHAKHAHKLKVYRFDYSGMRRALIDGTASGLAKFVCDGRGRLIGAHILGEGAAEVIHEAQIIRALKKPLHKLNLITHAYPTYAQALVGRAAQLAFLDRMGENLFVRAALRLLPGIDNRLGSARDRLAEKPPIKSEDKTARVNVTIESETNTPHPIHMKIVYVNDRSCILDLPEDLISHDERPIVAALAWNGLQDPEKIILNCARVRRINGLGASALVKFLARSKTKGQKIWAFGVSRDLENVFKVTELDQSIKICAGEREALSAVGVSVERYSNLTADEPNILDNMASWAKPVSELFVPLMPKEARNINVNGLRPVGPINGFGRLCQKIFRLHISDASISPEQAIAVLKRRVSRLSAFFQPLLSVRRGHPRR